MTSIDNASDDYLKALELDPAAIRALTDQARHYIDEGELPSLQLALARRGRLALTFACGEADTDAGLRVADDRTLYAGFSVTKAVVASALWLLAQEGRVDVQGPVADVIEEFAENGKERVLIEHLLTHTAGFPQAPFDPAEWPDREKRLARFSSWRLDWEPGSRVAYHSSSSMWVIAEIIERCANTDFREFIRARITSPLGLDDMFIGLPPGHDSRIAKIEFVGEPEGDGGAASRDVGMPGADTPEQTLTSLYNGATFRAVGVPGGGGIMTASDLAMFYQALTHGGRPGTERIWSAETLGWARQVRTGPMIDPMTGKRANRALGVVVAGDDERMFRGFAKGNSAEAFGHPGIGGQVGWADPVTGLSFAFFTNGHDRNPWRAGLRGITMSAKAVACVTQ